MSEATQPRVENPSAEAPLFHGALGMTRREPVTVTGADGAAFQAVIFTQINLVDSPHLRQALADGSATTVEDPTTGARYTLAAPVVVHNPSIGLFALVLPDSLRHQEFLHRRALLDRLSDNDGPIPRYVREFAVAIGPHGLDAAEAQAKAHQSGDSPQRAELQRLQREVEERARGLDEERQGLEAMRLNLEGAKARLQSQETARQKTGASPPPIPQHDNEPTTVVPREVFYGAASPLAESAKAAPPSSATTPKAAGWGSGLDQGWEIDQEPTSAPPPPLSRAGSPRARTSSNEIPVTDDVPRTFNRLKAGSRAWYHTLTGKRLLLSYRLGEDRMHRFQSGEPQLFLQFHDLDEFPLVTVLMAALDDEDNLQDDLYWPVNIRKLTDRRVLETLSRDFSLRVALYGEDLKLRQVLEFAEPLEVNAQHVLQLAGERLEGNEALSFDDALRRIEAPDYERLGSMRHNFHKDSFKDLDSPSAVKLAAGIVGYWSGPETFRYLIENRSFSLSWFAAIQERVVKGAAHFGIALTAELRQLAIDLGIAEDEGQLARDLTATWAEVELGVGKGNDLDPLETWENWQALIDAQEQLGDTLDDGLAELARASLRRAQGFAEDNDLLSAFPETNLDSSEPLAAMSVESNVPTFNHDPADSSEELLAETPIEELGALLSDPEKRLPAAIRLMKHGPADAVMDILMAAEHFEEDDLERLSEHLAACAPRLEDALLDCLELDSATIAYLCSFALAAVPSERALPKLLDALQDDNRAPDPALFSETLLPYGDALVDASLNALEGKDDPTADHPLIVLLTEYSRIGGDDVAERVKARNPKAGALLEG